MVFNRFRLIIIIRVIILSLTLILLSFFVTRSEWIMVSVLFIALIVYQIFSLIKYTELIVRDLKRFLDSIEYSDFSQSFSNLNLGPAFTELKHSFEKVTQKFLNIRSEKEERFQYFSTVVEHVGIGLISFKSDGEIEFINKSALNILQIGPIRNIKNIEALSKSLAEQLLNLNSGDQTLFKLKLNGHTLQLAINATQFKLKQQVYTLVSIQDIQNEVERERIARELEIGQEVQTKLLPKLDVEIPGYDLAGFCLPAREVGGDYFDIVQDQNGRLGLIIGDVSGKGLPAAIYMTLTKGILQACVSDNLSPVQVLSKANQLIYQIIERGFFVSILFAMLYLDSKRVVLARAGHSPLIYYNRTSDTVDFTEPKGMALGLKDNDCFNKEIEETEFHLENGDILVFYTDGFSEAMNEQKEEFGDNQLLQLINDHKSESAQAIIESIQREVDNHVGDFPRHDDMTMLVLKVID